MRQLELHAPRTALIHEWLTTCGGSERVVEQILRVLPQSELYALVDFLPVEQRGWLQGKTVHKSFVQRLPFARRKFRNYLPLMPYAFEQFDLSDYDLVISSSHAFAKGVVTRCDQLHISYVHTPMRYAWDLCHRYLGAPGLTRGPKGFLARATMHYLRLWDRLAADRVDVLACNSHYVARRIRKTYRREAHVIYPPVDVHAFELETEKEDFYLAGSRMVPYKRVDLIVEAFARMPDRQLVVIGDGPEYKRIAAKASPNVKLMGYQPFGALREHMRKARAFLSAADEDFGIMPVEAQACGTPVIAYGRGGLTETVLPGQTGLFFDHQDVESIEAAVKRFEWLQGSFDPEVIRQNAERFSPERFRGEFLELVEREWDKFCRGWHRQRDDGHGTQAPSEVVPKAAHPR